MLSSKIWFCSCRLDQVRLHSKLCSLLLIEKVLASFHIYGIRLFLLKAPLCFVVHANCCRCVVFSNSVLTKCVNIERERCSNETLAIFQCNYSGLLNSCWLLVFFCAMLMIWNAQRIFPRAGFFLSFKISFRLEMLKRYTGCVGLSKLVSSKIPQPSILFSALFVVFLCWINAVVMH